MTQNIKINEVKAKVKYFGYTTLLSTFNMELWIKSRVNRKEFGLIVAIVKMLKTSMEFCRTLMGRSFSGEFITVPKREEDRTEALVSINF